MYLIIIRYLLRPFKVLPISFTYYPNYYFHKWLI